MEDKEEGWFGGIQGEDARNKNATTEELIKLERIHREQGQIKKKKMKNEKPNVIPVSFSSCHLFSVLAHISIQNLYNPSSSFPFKPFPPSVTSPPPLLLLFPSPIQIPIHHTNVQIGEMRH